MKKQEDITDFIEIYDNGFNPILCNDLIRWFDLCSEKQFTVHNLPFVPEEGPPPISIRSDESIGVPVGLDGNYGHAGEAVDMLSLPAQMCNEIHKSLNNCFIAYSQKYDMGNMPLSNCRFKIHKVKPGQGYHVWHCENSHEVPSLTRVLAWMAYLKVPEEGGETEFLYQSKRIEPIVGRTLIWPAYFTHMHRGNPPLKGVKYYITGWFERL